MAHGNGILTAKDFQTDNDIRWCPGCGDYSILKQVQSILPEVEIEKHKMVFISGIGCSSRFPYYMDTYGMHSIHGRATAVASGVKSANPDLNVWVISGDGDGLSIGCGHTMHLLRRNFNLNMLLFNNQIYGLTKGQYSPTSEQQKVTKSTPMGSLDQPFNPLSLALGADAGFVARAMDRDPKHLKRMLLEAQSYSGTSFLEIYQNCNIFNDGAFFDFTEKSSKSSNTIFVEEGEPLVFGKESEKGIRLNGLQPEVVDLTEGNFSKDDLWIHNSSDNTKAYLLSRFFEHPETLGAFPRVFGVLYKNERATYEQLLHQQIQAAKETTPADLDQLIAGSQTWVVE